MKRKQSEQITLKDLKEYFSKHFFWVGLMLGIILEYFFINRWGNENTILWLILSMIGWEVSKLTND